MATAKTEPKGSFQAEGEEESQQRSVNGAGLPVDHEKVAPDEAEFGPAPEGGTRAYVTNSECPISGQ